MSPHKININQLFVRSSTSKSGINWHCPSLGPSAPDPAAANSNECRLCDLGQRGDLPGTWAPCPAEDLPVATLRQSPPGHPLRPPSTLPGRGSASPDPAAVSTWSPFPRHRAPCPVEVLRPWRADDPPKHRVPCTGGPCGPGPLPGRNTSRPEITTLQN